MGRFTPIEQMLQFQDFGVSGPGGGASLSQSGLSTTQDPMLAQLFSSFGQAAQGQLNQGGVPAGVQNVLQSFGVSPESQQYTDLGRMFGTQLQNFNINDFAAQKLGELNAMALPAEQNASNSLANRLFSRGRIGPNDTAGGRAFGELAQSLDLAQMARAQTAFGLAGQEANRIADYARTFGGLGADLSSNLLQRAISSGMAPSQIAGSQAGAASSFLGGGLSSLSPLQQQIQNLFAGSGMMQDVRNTIGTLKYDRLFGTGDSANQNGGALGALAGGVLGGIGTALGGPIGGAIGSGIGGLFAPKPPGAGTFNLNAGGALSSFPSLLGQQ